MKPIKQITHLMKSKLIVVGYILLALASGTASAAILPSGFSETVIASGLSAPTAMDFAPDGRLFVCQQGGQLRVIKNDVLLASAFLTVTTDSTGERGLLGIAFDPDFSNNQWVYIYYTVPGSPAHNRVSRFTANGDVAVPGSESVILTSVMTASSMWLWEKTRLRPTRKRWAIFWGKCFASIPTDQSPRTIHFTAWRRVSTGRFGRLAFAIRSPLPFSRAQAGCLSMTLGKTHGKRLTTASRERITAGLTAKARAVRRIPITSIRSTNIRMPRAARLPEALFTIPLSANFRRPTRVFISSPISAAPGYEYSILRTEIR